MSARPVVTTQFYRYVGGFLSLAVALFREHAVRWVKPRAFEHLTTSRTFGIILVVGAVGAISIALDLHLAGASQLLVAAWLVLAQVTVLLLMLPSRFVTPVVSNLRCAISARSTWGSTDPEARFRPPQR